MYDIPLERLSPIQLAARLAKEYAEHSTCCQAAAMIRDLTDEIHSLRNLFETTVKQDDGAYAYSTSWMRYRLAYKEYKKISSRII